jgi:hypothetical protein
MTNSIRPFSAHQALGSPLPAKSATKLILKISVLLSGGAEVAGRKHKAQRQPPPYGLGFGLGPCPSDFCECLQLSIDNGVHALSYEISPMDRESPLHITPVLGCCGDALLRTAEPLGLLK